MMKLGIIFGSSSTEHEVSVVSATSIIKNLDKEKYEIYPIYLDKDNNWCELLDDVKQIEIYKIGELPKNIKIIEEPFKYLKKLDIVFPVLHGKFGEDGSIQGLLEMLNILYVGCGILASSVALNKFYTKILLKKHLNVVSDISIKYKEEKFILFEDGNPVKSINLDELDDLIVKELNYPVFIKPASMGSSIGVSKAHNKKELEKSLLDAISYDHEILIEKAINGRELECAVFKGTAMAVGEVLAAEAYYTFDAKYCNQESRTVIPADIDDTVVQNIKKMAEVAFEIIDGKGLARIDFFLEDETNKLYINEINTMPGFTEISMYPKLLEEANVNYKTLLDELIMDAQKKIK